MSLKNPQTELPRGLSGASDTWDNDLAGFILTSEFFDLANVISRLKKWNSISWEPISLRNWNGVSWEIKPLKRWNGTTWELI